jgi:Na+/alanine symporter
MTFLQLQGGHLQLGMSSLLLVPLMLCMYIAIWIVVLLGLVEKVNINQTSDFR